MITAGELRAVTAVASTAAMGLSVWSVVMARRWHRRAVEAELLLDAATQATCPHCGKKIVPSQRVRKVDIIDDPEGFFDEA